MSNILTMLMNSQNKGLHCVSSHANVRTRGCKSECKTLLYVAYHLCNAFWCIYLCIYCFIYSFLQFVMSFAGSEWGRLKALTPLDPDIHDMELYFSLDVSDGEL